MPLIVHIEWKTDQRAFESLTLNVVHFRKTACGRLLTFNGIKICKATSG
jgi:hypothetical protein